MERGMDGLVQDHRVDSSGFVAGSSTRFFWQRTLKQSIGCVGVGLHSARRVHMELAPAAPGSGIVFRRTDVPGGPVDIPARYDRVAETPLCTELVSAERPDVRVATVEHLMAALAGSFVDNALITLDGPEVPILDGSAAPFLFLLDCAGIIEQEVPRRRIEILRSVRVAEGGGMVELRPPRAGRDGLELSLSITFPAAAIGSQAWTMRLDPESFRRELARARTFTFASEVAQLHANGRALGGSLENAVVVDEDRVLNPGGLRMPKEFVRHKLLDVVGDLALAGAALNGRFVGHCSGHALNNRLLRALFEDPSAWREIPSPLSVAA